MILPKRKNISQAKKFIKLLLRFQNESVSERILNYMFDNLISTILILSVLLVSLIIFFYYVNLPVHPTIQFDIQSTFYLFVTFPIIGSIIFIFAGLVLIWFYPGYLGYETFKILEQKFSTSEHGFKRTTRIIFISVYFPIIVLLLSLFVLPFILKSISILTLFYLLAFPIVALVYMCYQLRKISLEWGKIIICGCHLYLIWMIFLQILMTIEAFLKVSPLHLSTSEKYPAVISILLLILFFNVIISCCFGKMKSFKRFALVVFFGITTLIVIDMNFSIHFRVLQGLVKLVGIKKDETSIVVLQEACSIIKIRTPNIITKQQNGMCETIPVNILFNFGKNCLIDPLQKNVLAFSIPCDDIKS